MSVFLPGVRVSEYVCSCAYACWVVTFPGASMYVYDSVDLGVYKNGEGEVIRVRSSFQVHVILNVLPCDIYSHPVAVGFSRSPLGVSGGAHSHPLEDIKTRLLGALLLP